MPGTLRAVVRDYGSGAVVYINPVTTIIADVVAASPRPKRAATVAGARQRVYRVLQIPGWVNNADLSYSDRYFDGGSYLWAARRVGGMAQLDRQLVRDALTGGRPRRFIDRQVAGGQDGSQPSASAAAVSWLALPAGALVKEVFKALAAQAGKSLVGVGVSKAGTAALGWLLAAFGYGDVLKDQDILAIRQAVEALGKQVTQLQGDMALAGFSTLIHQTDRTIGEIDHAGNQLALLANLPDNDPTKRAFTDRIVDYIGGHLIDAPEILNQALGSNLPIADNLIKSASRAVSQRSRFFTPHSSAQVMSVYDYFAVYQAKLGILLQEYYHAQPQVYSPATATANLARIHSNVESQAGSLKPAVPDHTVIDTKTREMWITQLPGEEVDLNRILEIYYVRISSRGDEAAKFRLKPDAGPTRLPGFPFTDWEVPTLEAFERLVAGSNGPSPLDWLEKQGGFNKQLLEAAAGRKWARDGFSLPFGRFITQPFEIETFRLSTGRRDSRTRIDWLAGGNGWKAAFSKQKAGLMYVRKLPTGETYWWSS